MTIIEDIVGRVILDSRGNQTVEVEVFTETGYGRAAAPSGASTGEHEVAAWPEGGQQASIEALEDSVIPSLVDQDAFFQEDVDAILTEVDGTGNFERIGGNLAVAVSLAVAKAAADATGVPLYRYVGGIDHSRIVFPFGNILGGGAHAVGGTDIQEFMAVAMGASIKTNIMANAHAHKTLKGLLKEKLPTSAIGKGDEGAWVARLGNEDALKVVKEAVDTTSSELDIPMGVALDVAASEFFVDGKYRYTNTDGQGTGKDLSPEEQVDFMEGIIKEYGLVSVEDPFDQNDFESYVDLARRVTGKCLVVGDDLFVTNPERIAKGIEMKAANAVLIKVNQIGTLTRTRDAVRLAHDAGYKNVISHRSGETTDETIAHLALGFRCHGIKTGAVGGERLAKLNELIRIEEDWS